MATVIAYHAFTTRVNLRLRETLGEAGKQRHCTETISFAPGNGVLTPPEDGEPTDVERKNDRTRPQEMERWCKQGRFSVCIVQQEVYCLRRRRGATLTPTGYGKLVDLQGLGVRMCRDSVDRRSCSTVPGCSRRIR